MGFPMKTTSRNQGALQKKGTQTQEQQTTPVKDNGEIDETTGDTEAAQLDEEVAEDETV